MLWLPLWLQSSSVLFCLSQQSFDRKEKIRVMLIQLMRAELVFAEKPGREH
jgi:hypothetical protein